jgi:hypothetical protein
VHPPRRAKAIRQCPSWIDGSPVNREGPKHSHAHLLAKHSYLELARARHKITALTSPHPTRRRHTASVKLDHVGIFASILLAALFVPPALAVPALFINPLVGVFLLAGWLGTVGALLVIGAVMVLFRAMRRQLHRHGLIRRPLPR